jgi:hypothetical protein
MYLVFRHETMHPAFGPGDIVTQAFLSSRYIPTIVGKFPSASVLAFGIRDQNHGLSRSRETAFLFIVC